MNKKEEKRLKRQRKLSERSRTELQHMQNSATLTLHGEQGQNDVEYIAVAIHKGSKLVESRFFDACHYANGEKMTAAAIDYAKSCGSERCNIVKGMLPPERPFVRVADKFPESVN